MMCLQKTMNLYRRDGWEYQASQAGWGEFHSSVGSADGRYVHSVDPRDVGLGPVLLFLILGVLEEDEAEAALQVDPVDGDGGGTVVGDRVGENFLHVAHVDGVAEVAEEDGPVRSR